MRIVRFLADGAASYGILEDDKIYRLNGDVFGWCEHGPLVGTVRQVQLLAPCEPTKIISVGLNFRDQAKQLNAALPDEPIFCLKPPTSVIGTGETIVWPPASRRIDFEAEVGVVIGRVTKDVSPDEVRIFGVTCANDVTARDIQRRDGQWTRAKGYDTFCPLGPTLVTDLDPNHLSLTSRVNGDIRQQSSTEQLHIDIPHLVSFFSKIMTLLPGDVILTGTPVGNGPLQAGDIVEVEVEGVGVLRNTLVTR